MSKKLKTFKKSLSALMVAVILFGTLGPAPLIFAENKKIGDTDLVLEKLESKRLEKTEQLKKFDGKDKTKTFSADKNLKKTAETKQLQKPNYVPGEVLVKFKSQKINLEQSSGRMKAKQFAVSKNLDKKEDIRKNNISVLKIKDTKTVEEKIAELKNDSRVEYVQPNFQYYPLSEIIPWGLEKIEAPEAWEISEGDESEDDIIVAVIDDGVAYNHPDLHANMWNGNDCSGSDKNGNPLSGNCLHGYDYEDGDLDPLPTSGSHGTHIAGTIGAVKNDSGIIGVAPNVKIMAIKTSFTTDEIIKGIDFAEQNGAKVINASFGDIFINGVYDHRFFDQTLCNAIENFDGLFIAAAGNDSQNHDSGNFDTKMYPAAFDLDNIISVTATDQNDNLWEHSDYGVDSVDVGAPGVNIYSTGFVQELFTDATLPSFTNTLFTKTSGGWKTGTWDGIDKMAQANSSYINNDDGIITLTNPIDTTALSGDVQLKFYLQADIEYESLCLYDYLSVEVDNNDDNWTEKGYWCGGYNESVTTNLGQGSPNMRMRFVWHTNISTTGLQVPKIDDITISHTHSYQSCNGTSMAAPHVAGLAALIWGYKSGLSYSEVKDVILNTGDSLTSLEGKTTTGKRINAFNALDSLASSETEVSGNITEDTTWTLENSPYIVVSDLTIGEGIKLIIEPGVVIKFDDYYRLNNRGTLEARGTKLNPISFTSNKEVPNAGDWDIIHLDGLSENNIFEYVIFEYAFVPIVFGTNNNTPTEITNCEIRNNSGGVSYCHANSEISYSNFNNNSGDTINITGDCNVHHNNIVGGDHGHLIFNSGSGVVNINYNNLTIVNDLMRMIDNNSTIDINAQHNWWGTIDAQFIDNHIQDYEDNSILGKVIYTPFATAEFDFDDQTAPSLSEETPVPTPTNDSTPDYTFTSDEAGTITYGGLCSSVITAANVGDNTITFNELADSVYNDCTITVTDAVGNASAPLNVSSFTIDTQIPVITLLGDNPVNLYVGDTYEDAGATAEDNIDGDITENIITVNPVNTSIIGTYAITYNVSDVAGNPADEVTRIVNVSEAPPVNTPPEMQAVALLPNPAYTNDDINAIAFALDDDIMDIPTLSYQWKKNGEDVGENDLTLSSDNFVKGDEIKVVVTPNDGKVDGEPMESDPIIISNSAPTQPTVSISPDPAYTDNNLICFASGSTDIDDDDELSYLYQWYKNDVIQEGYTSNEILSSLTNVGDTWKCEAVANDGVENSSVGESSILISEIPDTIPPVITLLGDNPVELCTGPTCVTDYQEAGATALDNVDGDITSSIVIGGDVISPSSEAGTYEITYNVSDSAGNPADEVIRTVIINQQIVIPPVRSNGSPTGALSAGTTETTLSLTTDKDATCKYSTTADTEYSEMTGIFDTTDETDHSTLITGLTNGNSYTYYIRCQDIFGAKNTDDYEISFSVASPSSGGGGGGGGGSYTPSSVLSSDNPLKISSSQKGTLTQNLNNENKVKVEIPKGSIKSTTTFTASEGNLEEGDIPKDKIGAFLFNGLVFNIEAVDASNNAVREFSEDLTITLTVPDLPDDTSGLELYYFDDESGEWIIITDIEFGDGVITFKVNHLTLFALFEIPEPIVKGVETVELSDGDVVRIGDDEKVYVIKIIGDKKFKRHIVSPKVFNSYGHLNWDMIKSVSSLDDYSLSAWVRNCTGPNGTPSANDKVYEVNADSTMHWLNMTAQQFYARGGSDEAIYNINDGELNLYILGVDVMYQ